MEQEKKLFLLDAYALIFRAYYAFINRPIRNSHGLNTSAIYGFVNSLEEVLRTQKPDFIGVVFDPPGGSFRNNMYPEYKANRDETPEDIILSVPHIKEILNAYQIPILEVPGFEADDVIGTLAKRFGSDKLKVYMMTPDKDYAQVISENIVMYKPAKGGNAPEVVNMDNLAEKFGLSKPEQIIDMLALMGDSADNIPGIPGIGPKTAVKLLNTYGSINNLLENTHELKGKQKENIEGNLELLSLSKKLVTINTEVAVEVTLEQLKHEAINKEALTEKFDYLGFNTLKNRIIGETAAQVNAKPVIAPVQGGLFDNNTIAMQDQLQTFNEADQHYTLLSTDNLPGFVKMVKDKKMLCFDTETTSLHVMEAELLGIALAVEPKKAFYLDVLGNNNLFNKVQELLEDETIEKIGHNLKYDIQIMEQHGCTVNGHLFDTMIVHYLLQPDRKHKLDILASEYLHYKMIPIESLIGRKGKTQGNMKSVPVQQVVNYACEDADITLQLYHLLNKKLLNSELENVYRKIEMPLIPVLSRMERNGVALNTENLAVYLKKLNTELIGIEERIYSYVNYSFNINSPKQLGEVLFDRLKIDDKAKKTKSKQYSTSEETLQKLADKHPIVNDILEYRSVKKLTSTYVEALPRLISKNTGRIHTSFNQTIAATGRLSSTSPNLQNIPIREERGREIRKSFVPGSNGYLMLSADYSQIELRLMAHLSGDENMIAAFQSGEDIHASTAAKIYKISVGQVSRETRSKAKTANFGIIYGISAFGLAQRLNIPRSEAKELIDGYFATFPGVKAYMDESIEKARKNGYVTTMYGRRRYLNDINARNSLVRGMAERNAINAPIQGSAADIIKLAMIDIHNEIGYMKSKMLLQVHDELVFEVDKTELTDIQAIIKDKMEKVVALKVPLTIEMNYGNNWLEAH